MIAYRKGQNQVLSATLITSPNQQVCSTRLFPWQISRHAIRAWRKQHNYNGKVLKKWSIHVKILLRNGTEQKMIVMLRKSIICQNWSLLVAYYWFDLLNAKVEETRAMRHASFPVLSRTLLFVTTVILSFLLILLMSWCLPVEVFSAQRDPAPHAPVPKARMEYHTDHVWVGAASRDTPGSLFNCVNCHTTHDVMMPHEINPRCNTCHSGSPVRSRCPSCHSVHGVDIPHETYARCDECHAGGLPGFIDVPSNVVRYTGFLFHQSDFFLIDADE